MTLKSGLNSDVSGAAAYVREVKKIPMLAPGEEFELARALRAGTDPLAAEKLARSHLRQVVKIAMGFRHYGIPVEDLIAEGNIGLLKAIERYDPERGFKLSTFAMWWIRAGITEYVLKNWSLVRHCSNRAQKTMFFNLRRARERLATKYGVEDLDANLAAVFNTSVAEVRAMTAVLSGDSSLNAVLGEDSGGTEHIDLLPDERDEPETHLADKQDRELGAVRLAAAMSTLNERERTIIRGRRLSEPVMTLEELAGQFGISRERIRQIEGTAFRKLQDAILHAEVPRTVHEAPARVPAGLGKRRQSKVCPLGIPLDVKPAIGSELGSASAFKPRIEELAAAMV